MKQTIPLKLLVIAELSPRDELSGLSPSREARIPVDKDTFSEVMQKLANSVTLKTRNLISSRPEELTIKIPPFLIIIYPCLLQAEHQVRQLTPDLQT